MKNTYHQQHDARMKEILSALPKLADEELREFVRRFYAKTPISDLQRTKAERAAAIATSAHGFMESRNGKEPKIRLFVPAKKTHGYDGQYPVIELINDDMPFLVDSLSAELTRQGFTVRETIHPIFKVVRDKQGRLQKLAAATNQRDASYESLIHFEISALPEGMTQKQLIADLEAVLTHIRAAVEDWDEIVDKAGSNIAEIEKVKKRFDSQTIAEAEAFLRWLVTRNFVFLGYAEYNFFDAKGNESLSVVPGSRLGILKLPEEEEPRGLEALPPEIRHFLLVPQLIEITKSNRKSMVHRTVPMDYIGVKRFDKDGKIIGEARFLGLFTSNVYYQSADVIPLLRQKINHVVQRSDFDPISHDGKSLKAILEFLPRDEIFQMSDDDLFETSMGILALEAKPGVRAFVRKDAFERFVSIMVFVPREQFSTDLRRQIQEIVEKAFGGTSSTFSTQITEAPLARLHVIVKTTPGEIPPADISAIEQEIAKRAYLWGDLLQGALFVRHGEQKAEKYNRLYGHAFPQNYINRYDAGGAVYDIEKIEEAITSGAPTFDLFRNRAEAQSILHLKMYNPHEDIALSDILPMIENAGFRAIEEHPFQVTRQERANPVRIRDFTLQAADGSVVALAQVKQLLEEALLKVWQRDMENDRFNALVIAARLTWRQVTMLRAYARYLKQVGFTYSQPAIEQALVRYPAIAADIVALFEARFDPATKNRDEREKRLRKLIDDQLVDVSSAADDIILRRYVEVIMATLRTNYFQTQKDGSLKPVLSFKLDSKHVPEMPAPKPFAEIYVYSPRIEGIHLRGGKVARGGLRWSDRHEDFRTEVLGLMKAQMVKNAVIVPVGSKGGFVVRRPPASGVREAVMEEGIACYKLYLSGLLDITDNIVKGKIVPPSQVVRHDEDDPYLVVAADKGTASFSDIANDVSADYSFWLGDAFASGGSAGYDHKEMGITARGGWVSVVRHFRELGIDISQKDFTVSGIGDMSGDVFGNGMLLSEHIRLVAAFNHQHIFIDPTPDAAISFAERKRLFHLPRSSWKDYDAKLISKGGGIFERSAKSIALSKEAQAMLGVSKSNMTPDELVRSILLSPVDLLWNGGIGTYVKAEEETHEQVGDRANNSVRVNGKELRCKVVGEGGNLGFTQKGRIEYARSGGKINTDAIDNSAGVDCSDHEVNIKIALSQEVTSGKLSLALRNRLLASMTDDVAALVLKDNILQTQAITIAEQQGHMLLESQTQLMHMLERGGLLNRVLEFLPTDKHLAELKATRKGLTRPELAVLLAYSKMALYRDLLDSTLPDEAYFLSDLQRYFPKPMQKKFAGAIDRHPLKREIIATVVTNSLVNRAGITFYSDIAEDMDVSVRDIAAAYALGRDAFSLRELWDGIEALDGVVTVAVQAEMYGSINRFLSRVAVWFLRNLPLPLDIDTISAEITPGIAEIEKNKATLHSDATRKEAERIREHLTEHNVPKKLAERIAGLEVMASATDIISVAHKNKIAVVEAGKLFFAVGQKLGLGWLRQSAYRIATVSHWDRLAVQSLVNDLGDEHRRLVNSVLGSKKDFDGWSKLHEEQIEHLQHFMQELKSGNAPDLPKLTVALKHIKNLSNTRRV